MNTIQKIFLIGLIPFMLFFGCEKEKEYVDLNWIRHDIDAHSYVFYRHDVGDQFPNSGLYFKCIWIHLYKSEKYYEYYKVGSDDPESTDIDYYSNVTYDER